MTNFAAVLANLNQESKSIFSLIQKEGPLTKNAIMAAAGIKLTKLNRLMAPLEKAKLIAESSVGDSTGGRKPILYDVNQRAYLQSLVCCKKSILTPKSF